MKTHNQGVEKAVAVALRPPLPNLNSPILNPSGAIVPQNGTNAAQPMALNSLPESRSRAPQIQAARSLIRLFTRSLIASPRFDGIAPNPGNSE